MNFEFAQVMSLLIAGGILGAGGGIVGVLLQNKNEKELEKKRRIEKIADRDFDLKREAYTQALKVFNEAVVLHISAGRERSINTEEFLRANEAMTLLDIYGSNTIKVLAASIMAFLQQDIPTVQGASEAFQKDVVNKMRALTEAIKEDLRIDSD